MRTVFRFSPEASARSIKFCVEGCTVTIRVEIHDDKAQLWVSDTGPGMPEEQARHVFDRYPSHPYLS
ncbi:MAG: sensor histidine kinase, partial [Planctomycetota bacterium]